MKNTHIQRVQREKLGQEMQEKENIISETRQRESRDRKEVKRRQEKV